VIKLVIVGDDVAEEGGKVDVLPSSEVEQGWLSAVLVEVSGGGGK
jgi:hypothetical protein